MLKRAGHTEASSDLAKLAGLKPGAVICEIMNDDGSMARVPDLIAFAEEKGLRIITVSDLISHRLRHETLVERVASPKIPTRYGDIVAHGYRSDLTGEMHVAFVLGKIDPEETVLVRVHSQSLLSDLFGSLGGDSAPLPPGASSTRPSKKSPPKAPGCCSTSFPKAKAPACSAA